MQFTHYLPRFAASFFFGLSAMTALPSVEAAASLEEQCEGKWIRDSSALMPPGSSGSPRDLLRQWLLREAACGSTSIYWGRLAMVQLLTNDLNAAKASLARTPTTDPAFSYAVDLAAVQVTIQERMLNQEPVTREDIAKFEDAYAAVVVKHPKWPTGYAMLGGMQTLLGKHTDAVRNLQTAAKGEVYQVWSVYRNLTISLSALGKHADALAAADKAGHMNPSLLSDPPFVYAVAISHAALGYLEDAKDALKVIAARRPDVRKDPEYVRAVEFYQDQRAQFERKNNR